MLISIFCNKQGDKGKGKQKGDAALEGFALKSIGLPFLKKKPFQKALPMKTLEGYVEQQQNLHIFYNISLMVACAVLWSGL